MDLQPQIPTNSPLQQNAFLLPHSHVSADNPFSPCNKIKSAVFAQKTGIGGRGLGKHTESCSSVGTQGFQDEAEKTKHRQEYKKRKYKAQSIIQGILSQCAGKWRVTGCGKKRIDKNQNVYVQYNPEHKTASYANIQSCGSGWLCPVCSEKKARESQKWIEQVIVIAQKHGLKAHMLTLTVPHHHDDLQDLTKKLTKAMAKFWRDRSSQKFWNTVFPNIGHITAIEFKYSDENGWHPHYHIIIFTKEAYTEQAIKGTLGSQLNGVGVLGIQQRICNLWAEKCVKVGLKRPSLRHGVDLKRGYNDNEMNNAKALIDYALKGAMANELALSNYKTGRFNKESLTPFEIALLAEHEGDFEDDDSKYSHLFYQYAKASFRKSQSHPNATLTKFLRENGLNVVEPEEPEQLPLADDGESLPPDDSPKVVYDLTIKEWRNICKDYEARGNLLVLVEKDIAEFGVDTLKFPRVDAFVNAFCDGSRLGAVSPPKT